MAANTNLWRILRVLIKYEGSGFGREAECGTRGRQVGPSPAVLELRDLG